MHSFQSPTEARHWPLEISPVAKKVPGDKGSIRRGYLRAHTWHVLHHDGTSDWGTATGNTNLAWIIVGAALTLHVNGRLAYFDCSVWLALSEVRSGQTDMVSTDESHTSVKLHFGKNKLRISLISWSARLSQIWVAVLPSSASIRFNSSATFAARLTIELLPVVSG